MAFQSEFDFEFESEFISLTNAINIKKNRIENKKQLISIHITSYLRIEETLSKYIIVL